MSPLELIGCYTPTSKFENTLTTISPVNEWRNLSVNVFSTTAHPVNLKLFFKCQFINGTQFYQTRHLFSSVYVFVWLFVTALTFHDVEVNLSAVVHLLQWVYCYFHHLTFHWFIYFMLFSSVRFFVLWLWTSELKDNNTADGLLCLLVLLILPAAPGLCSLCIIHFYISAVE